MTTLLDGVQNERDPFYSAYLEAHKRFSEKRLHIYVWNLL